VACSVAEGELMSDDIGWIRSSVTAESDGTFETLCVYQPSRPDAGREHAQRTDMPADETVVSADSVDALRPHRGRARWAQRHPCTPP